MPKIQRCDRFISLIIGTSFIVLTLTISSQALGQSDIRLKPQSCSAEDSLRSLDSQISTNIRFINQKAFRVKVYWIDFTGKRQHYFDLEPNQTYDQQTFVSHPWLVTEAGDNQPCINIFFPNEKPGIVIID
jgi:VHL beta domain